MKRLLLALSSFACLLTGCCMCAGPYDYCAPTFTGCGDDCRPHARLGSAYSGPAYHPHAYFEEGAGAEVDEVDENFQGETDESVPAEGDESIPAPQRMPDAIDDAPLPPPQASSGVHRARRNIKHVRGARIVQRI